MGMHFANTIAVTNGDATVTKNAADSVEVGDVLDILGVAYIVKQVTSNHFYRTAYNLCGIYRCISRCC